jgi:hypothetical protein
MPTKDREKQLQYQRDFYYRNRAKVIEENRQRQLEIKDWYIDYKSELACIKCGENEPCCLAFHHRESSEKDIEISRAVNQGWSIKRILEEIDKCDVVCHNCHSKLHAGIA